MWEFRGTGWEWEHGNVLGMHPQLHRDGSCSSALHRAQISELMKGVARGSPQTRHCPFPGVPELPNLLSQGSTDHLGLRWVKHPEYFTFSCERGSSLHPPRWNLLRKSLLWLSVHPWLLGAGSVPVPSAAAASPPAGCVREAEQGMFSISPCYFWLGCLLCNRCGNCYAWGFIKETLRALPGRNICSKWLR